MKPPLKRGSDNGNSVLTEEQVKEIHRLWALKKHRRTELARLFGVSWQTILGIVTGRLWKHIFKGKQGFSLHLGEGHVAHKLTEASVKEIRQRVAQGETCTSLSEAYGVSTSVISEIKHRKAWKHVT